MRILFAGTPALAVPILEALLASPHEVVGVLTQPDAPAGRKRVLTPSPVKEAALAHGLTVLAPPTLKDTQVQDEVAALQADVCVVVAYGQLIAQSALDVLPNRFINLHFSQLPAYRGAAPVQRSIIDGLETTHATLFVLDAGMDTGDVLATREVRIGQNETAGELLERMAAESTQWLIDTVQAYVAGTLTPQPQQGQASHAAKLSTAEGHLDWSLPARELQQKIRGFWPNPGCWTTLGDVRCKIAAVELVDPAQAPDLPTLLPGQLALHAKRAYVGCGDAALVLKHIVPAGKKSQDGAAFLRGQQNTDLQFS